MSNRKPNLKDLIWLFIIGSFIGFILETVWYYIKHGVFINKQGLLYGPFKPIYGFGLIIIILTMYKFYNKKLWQKFILGVIIGSTFEYFGSVFQEFVFGTSTWNYGSFKLSLGSRLYLPYCLCWGIMARFKKIIKKIPKKIFNVITICVTIFMFLNILLTVIVTIRYSNRANTNTVLKIIDDIYNDEYMQKKFPKLKIIKKKS